MLIRLIAAMDRNRVIGDGRGLPWHLPADLRRFRALTIGKPAIVGRRTYETFVKPLPGRMNLVLTRRPEAFVVPGGAACGSLADALARAAAAGAAEVSVIGGAEVYAAALPHAHELDLTIVDGTFAGHVLLPDTPGWRLASRETFPADDRNPFARFVELWRNPQPIAWGDEPPA